MTIDELLKQERNRIHAYIDKNKPFDYLRYINKTYFKSMFSNETIFDIALDNYNHAVRQGVKGQAKEWSLINTFNIMYKCYERLKQ
jgi:hypothetical protein